MAAKRTLSAIRDDLAETLKLIDYRIADPARVAPLVAHARHIVEHELKPIPTRFERITTGLVETPRDAGGGDHGLHSITNTWRPGEASDESVLEARALAGRVAEAAATWSQRFPQPREEHGWLKVAVEGMRRYGPGSNVVWLAGWLLAHSNLDATTNTRLGPRVYSSRDAFYIEFRPAVLA